MAPQSQPPGGGRSRETGQDGPEVRVPPPGPRSIEAAERLVTLECPAFRKRRARRAALAQADEWPIVLAAGKGSNLYDLDDNRYVDLAAGFGSILLGHGAAEVTRAIEAQSERLVQGLGDACPNEVKVALLDKLAALHPGEHPMVLLGQSGGGAVTAAIKTAALATGRAGIVGFDGAYHGLGFAPLAACGYRESFRQPFAAQLNPHARFAPYPGYRGASAETALEFLQQELRTGDVGAVLLEPVLGRGGCVVPPKGFVAEVCALAHRYGALVVADEIWTALGRSGAMVRSRELNAPVDILCLGKGLGGGLAISACVAPEPIMMAWDRSDEVIHTSTHAGAPLGCAAALATLETIARDGLVERARKLGERVLKGLGKQLAACDSVVDVRGTGLMIGIELEGPTVALRAISELLGRGYLVLGGGLDGRVLTLTPSLTIAEQLLVGFGEALAEILQRPR